MASPIEVSLVRGPHVESRHVVHAVVADVDGAVVRSWGDPDRLTHPRSAVKPLQALPLVESGATDAAGLGDVELALACASHAGEAGHVDAVRAWLERIGCGPGDLECGGEDPLANTCSGKHVGFLTLARHLGVPTAGYVRADHPVQRAVVAAVADVCEVRLDPVDAGTDGCSIPVHPVPLRSLAAGAARIGAPPGRWTSERRAAVGRLTAAMVAEPWYVGGTGRLCTDLLVAGAGDVLVKFGAEGVQLCSLPLLGLGMAVKCEDGSVPASEVALGHVLAALERSDRSDVFEPRRRVRNAAGTHVADLVVTAG